MAYEKMHNIFDLAIRMQSSAEGISIADVMQQFDVSRRTAERMRNFIRERFPQLTETIGEHGVKRWHLPYGALKNYISFSAEEISTLQNALRLLKHVQLCEQSRTLAGLLTKLKAMMRPEVCCRIETDTEIMQASEGYLFRPVQKIEINPRHLALLRHAVTAKNYIFHPRQQVRENPNGSLTVSFRAGGVLELDRCLYGWGPHVKVIKPKNWKHMVREAKKHV